MIIGSGVNRPQKVLALYLFFLYCFTERNISDWLVKSEFYFSVESVRSEDDEESEESEDEDIFVPKEFVEIREGDVQTYYCIEEEVGRYVCSYKSKYIVTP